MKISTECLIFLINFKYDKITTLKRIKNIWMKVLEKV